MKSKAEKKRLIGQRFEAKPRTEDITIDEAITFSDLILSPNIIKGLTKAGFHKPSPIQLKAIPLGRFGLDLVVQAKSGTGKTCVFAIVALESVDISIHRPQALVLAPTREIAMQIEQVISAIGQDVPGLVCHCAIGGLSVKADRKKVRNSHIIIGTPGRVRHLIESGDFSCQSVRLFVLDEADKLMDDSFQEQINWIYSGLPESKQVIAASATYTEQLVEHMCHYMFNPTFLRLNSNDPVLLGVNQFVRTVQDGSLPNQAYNNKVKALTDLLSKTNFQQCLVFSNLQTRAENLSRLMNVRGWPATYIAGGLEQIDRIEAIYRLKAYDCRILISTDLTARGIDADRVDLVINLDLPMDMETYLHRVGRAGRFGARGAAVSLVTPSELMKLQDIAAEIKTTIHTLPEEIPADFIHVPGDLLPPEVNKQVSLESFQILNRPEWNGRKETDEEGSVAIQHQGPPLSDSSVCESLSQLNGVADDDQTVSIADSLTQDENNTKSTSFHAQHSVSVADTLTEINSTTLYAQTSSENSGETGHEYETRARVADQNDFVVPPLIKLHRPPFKSIQEAREFVKAPGKLANMQFIGRENLIEICKKIRNELSIRENVQGLMVKSETGESATRQSPGMSPASQKVLVSCDSLTRSLQTIDNNQHNIVQGKDSDEVASDGDVGYCSHGGKLPSADHSHGDKLQSANHSRSDNLQSADRQTTEQLYKNSEAEKSCKPSTPEPEIAEYPGWYFYDGLYYPIDGYDNTDYYDEYHASQPGQYRTAESDEVNSEESNSLDEDECYSQPHYEFDDRLAEALQTHYKQVYQQHSYIVHMARK